MVTKEAKVIMLPTEESMLNIDNGILNYHYPIPLLTDIDEGGKIIAQHLYITTDDEIKEGDWCYDSDIGIIFRNVNRVNDEITFKIIATTDESLTKEEKGYNWDRVLLPQPSQAFIEKYCKVGGIDEVLVEYEWNGGRAGDYDIEPKVDSHNTITIHPIKDSWTRKEVKELIISYEKECGVSTMDTPINWIKKNL